jgi:hypothetical protein
MSIFVPPHSAPKNQRFATPLPTPPQVEGGLCRLHGQFEVRPIICTSEPPLFQHHFLMEPW